MSPRASRALSPACGTGTCARHHGPISPRQLALLAHRAVFDSSDALHLLVEIENETELERAMKGLGVRVARSVNRVLRRKGNVVAGRYHVHPLRTPREVRHVFAYVICNAHKHRAISSGWDPWSSAAWFEVGSGRSGRAADRYRERVPIPVARAQTWLLSTDGRTSWGLRGAPTKVRFISHCRSRPGRLGWKGARHQARSPGSDDNERS